MASTKLAQRRPETLEATIFSFAATGATETFQLAAGTKVYGVCSVITSVTARVVGGYNYVIATGVLTVGVVANTDTGFCVVIHE